MLVGVVCLFFVKFAWLHSGVFAIQAAPTLACQFKRNYHTQPPGHLKTFTTGITLLVLSYSFQILYARSFLLQVFYELGIYLCQSCPTIFCRHGCGWCWYRVERLWPGVGGLKGHEGNRGEKPEGRSPYLSRDISKICILSSHLVITMAKQLTNFRRRVPGKPLGQCYKHRIWLQRSCYLLLLL